MRFYNSSAKIISNAINISECTHQLLVDLMQPKPCLCLVRKLVLKSLDLSLDCS